MKRVLTLLSTMAIGAAAMSWGCVSKGVSECQVSGFSPEKVEALYGAPTESADVVLASETLSELRLSLVRQHPELGAPGIVVRECRWADRTSWKPKLLRHNRTVWFKRSGSTWVAVEGVEWRGDVQF